MISIVILNNKGGVGKTTSVVNIAGVLARKGKNTLLIDLDPAASASMHLGLDKNNGRFKTLCDFIIDDAPASDEYIQQTAFRKLDCLPSEPALSDFYDELAQEQNGGFFLERDHLPARYDFILFDAPPNMGSLAFNALALADYVLIPVQTQYLALNGLQLTLKTVDKVRRHLNPGLKILGIFGTQFDRRTRVARDVLQLLHDTHGPLMFKTAIGVNSKLVEAYNAQKPIIYKTPAARGALEYTALTREIQKRIKSDKA